MQACRTTVRISACTRSSAFCQQTHGCCSRSRVHSLTGSWDFITHAMIFLRNLSGNLMRKPTSSRYSNGSFRSMLLSAIGEVIFIREDVHLHKQRSTRLRKLRTGVFDDTRSISSNELGCLSCFLTSTSVLFPYKHLLILELSNECLLTKIGFGTAENEPLQVWM